MTLRQKQYTLFIRGYCTMNGQEIPYEQESVYVRALCPECNSSCTAYDVLEGGSPWMEYEDPRLPTNSFTILREVIKDLIQTKGYKKEHFKVCEVVPTDMLITPYK